VARVGILGTGWGARVQVPTFREAGLQVTAIAGFHGNRTREAAAGLGVRPHDDWHEVVTADDVDVDSIVTPPSEHREMAAAALQAGKHVLLEKPTAMNAAEAEELVKIAGQNGGLLAMIDHELRFLPSWREARRRMGEIGATRYAEVRYASPSRGDRKREWNWWSDASRGGGIWGAVGSHFVDALRYFGNEVEAAHAIMKTTIDRRPFGTSMRAVTSDDFGSVTLRLAGGALAVMTFSAVASGPDETSILTIYGERGAMRFIGEEVLLSTGGNAFTTLAGGPMESRPGNSPGGAFGTGTLHLGRALRAALDDGDLNALAPGATFEDGLMQQRVLDAARASASQSRWVEI